MNQFFRCGCRVKAEVIDSWVVNDSDDEPPYIRRRRKCPKCGVKFSTMEVVCVAGKGTKSHVKPSIDTYLAMRKRITEEVTADMIQYLQKLTQ